VDQAYTVARNELGLETSQGELKQYIAYCLGVTDAFFATFFTNGQPKAKPLSQWPPLNELTTYMQSLHQCQTDFDAAVWGIHDINLERYNWDEDWEQMTSTELLLWAVAKLHFYIEVYGRRR